MKTYKTFLGVILLIFLLASCISSENVNTLEKEQIDLVSYLKSLETRGYNIDTTALGVYYIRLMDGTGDLPEDGDTISVKYAGYLMSGEIFDTSFYNSADSSWTYIYKTQKVLASWDEITGMMNKGCKMQAIIPSSLAYGASGAGRIPPYSTLIFVVIMSDIHKRQ
jgi:FKBP-type peptidyl-prolyl cis-trans isomerase FkpA